MAESNHRVLNEIETKENKPSPTLIIAEKLQKTLLKLKGEFMSCDGKSIDYQALRQSSDFSEYEKQASELNSFSLKNLTETQKKVFFINIYNALTIHGLAKQNELPNSILKIQNFFKTVAYNIGGFVFTLDDIEHGILRGNRNHPSFPHPQFDAEDPRLHYVLKNFDPRIHFALVCGAKSCPAINIYTESNVETALEAAVRTFCESEVGFREETDEVYLSKIFYWYRQDFGERDIDVLRWIMPYLSDHRKKPFSAVLLKLEQSGSVTLNYNDYNWSLNTA